MVGIARNGRTSLQLLVFLCLIAALLFYARKPSWLGWERQTRTLSGDQVRVHVPEGNDDVEQQSVPTVGDQDGLSTYKGYVQQPSVHIGNQSEPAGYTSAKGYVFSLYYYDQQTACLRNLLSLQCWAVRFGLKVVEPFVVNTFFGMPLQEVMYSSSSSKLLRFSDIYDFQEWNENYMKPRSYPQFATWEEFLRKAPRDVIMIRNPIRTKTCNFSQTMNKCLLFLRNNNFTVIRNVCLPIQSRSALTLGEVDSLILGNQTSKAEVTVIFEQWRGFVVLGQEQLMRGITLKEPCECSRRAILPPMTELNVTANHNNKRHPEQNIHNVLNAEDYIAVMIRYEYM